MVEAYEVYRQKDVIDSNEIVILIRFGERLNGHRGIVHGGITALCIDNSYGWLFFCLGKPMAVTANLSINYRKPVYANTTAMLKVKFESLEGRKMKMSATLHDLSGNLLVESTTLFITMKQQNLWLFNMIPTFLLPIVNKFLNDVKG